MPNSNVKPTVLSFRKSGPRWYLITLVVGSSSSLTSLSTSWSGTSTRVIFEVISLILNPLNLNFKAVTKRVASKTKRESYTNRAKKARELKVCFNLPENEIAEKGEIKFYIQVTDPKNNVLGKKKTIYFNEKSLTYSFDKVIKYNNKAMEVCGYINTAFIELPAGSYIVQLFRNDEFISKEKLALF